MIYLINQPRIFKNIFQSTRTEQCLTWVQMYCSSMVRLNHCNFELIKKFLPYLRYDPVKYSTHITLQQILNFACEEWIYQAAHPIFRFISAVEKMMKRIHFCSCTVGQTMSACSFNKRITSGRNTEWQAYDSPGFQRLAMRMPTPHKITTVQPDTPYTN